MPSGHLHWFSPADDSDAGRETGRAVIADAFARGITEGLIALAAKDDAADLSPTLGYWRAFTCRYLAARCQMTPADPARPDPVAALDEQ